MIARYLKLYLHFVRFSLGKTFSFRVNFWFRILMDVIYAAILIFFYEIIYAKVGSLTGWTRSQALVFVGACLVLDSIQMTFFSDNLNSFSEKVRQGDLDYYLVRPISPLFMMTLREVSINSALNLLIACSILGVYLSGVWSDVSFSRLALFFALLLNGAYLYYLTRLLFVLPVFWLGSIRGLDTLFYNLYYCVDRPDAIFRGPIRTILTTFVPFCLMASFPARALFHGDIISIVLHMWAVSLSLSLFVLFVWRRGLRSYSSASS